MVETKASPHHPASMEQRVSDKLKPSGDIANADVVVKKGDGPNRTITSIHHGGTARKHGSDDRDAPGIDGGKRGTV